VRVAIDSKRRQRYPLRAVLVECASMARLPWPVREYIGAHRDVLKSQRARRGRSGDHWPRVLSGVRPAKSHTKPEVCGPTVWRVGAAAATRSRAQYESW